MLELPPTIERRCAMLLAVLPPHVEAACRLGAPTTLLLTERGLLLEVAVEAGGEPFVVGHLETPNHARLVAIAALTLGWFVLRDGAVAARWLTTATLHAEAHGVASEQGGKLVSTTADGLGCGLLSYTLSFDYSKFQVALSDLERLSKN